MEEITTFKHVYFQSFEQYPITTEMFIESVKKRLLPKRRGRARKLNFTNLIKEIRIL